MQWQTHAGKYNDKHARADTMAVCAKADAMVVWKTANRKLQRGTANRELQKRICNGGICKGGIVLKTTDRRKSNVGSNYCKTNF